MLAPELLVASFVAKAPRSCPELWENAPIGLPKCVSVGYTAAMKDVGLRIRVQRELRESFLEACRQEDKPAAQVLREFMRSFVEQRSAGNLAAGALENNKKK